MTKTLELELRYRNYENVAVCQLLEQNKQIQLKFTITDWVPIGECFADKCTCVVLGVLWLKDDIKLDGFSWQNCSKSITRLDVYELMNTSQQLVDILLSNLTTWLLFVHKSHKVNRCHDICLQHLWNYWQFGTSDCNSKKFFALNI